MWHDIMVLKTALNQYKSLKSSHLEKGSFHLPLFHNNEMWRNCRFILKHDRFSRFNLENTWVEKCFSLWLLGVHKRTMLGPLVFCAKLLITLVTLVLKTSRKVDIFYMHRRHLSPPADLPTQVTLEPSLVFSFSESAWVSIQVRFNSSSTFPTCLHSIILHLQCSQLLHLHQHGS